MIDVVTLEKTTFAAPPSRFEAGTPAIAEAIGFGAACDYLQHIGMDNVEAYEKHLGLYLHSKVGIQLSQISCDVSFINAHHVFYAVGEYRRAYRLRTILQLTVRESGSGNIQRQWYSPNRFVNHLRPEWHCGKVWPSLYAATASAFRRLFLHQGQPIYLQHDRRD